MYGFRLLQCLLAACVSVQLAACQTVAESPAAPLTGDVDLTASAPEPEELKYFPSEQPLRLALQHFHRGNIGLAERYFRDAVEKSPNNAAAWIGLAASYDHTKRFDLADRAYVSAIRISGQTKQILNNQGYSYMLRGDYKTARAKFMKAHQQDPTDLTIINNLEILSAKDRANPSAS